MAEDLCVGMLAGDGDEAGVVVAANVASLRDLL